MSLELEVILPALLDFIRQQVTGVRMRYTNPDLNLSMDFGGAVLKNQCFYQLKTDEQALGEIRFSNATRFSESELHAIERSLTHLLHPLRNALLYQQAVRNARQDALTGVGNRFAFSRTFEREQLLAKRHGTDLALLILDIDHFKQVNDEYGHLAGDKVLRCVADAMTDVMRATDEIFRYGGEEFTAILPTTDDSGAHVIAERIRKRVEQLEVQFEERVIKVTMSIGVASTAGIQVAAQLFEQADANLYQAKRSGRNRVI
jgi:diguanylate cyclase (GGDEF)-like protein